MQGWFASTLGRVVSCLVMLVLFSTQLSAKEVEKDAKQITGRDIVAQCDFKNPGNDQRSQLTINLIDQYGEERKTVYLRLWKDMKGKDGILDKMVLFTLYPPDAKGAAFMRWAYDPKEGKHAEQWIYLPTLRKIRRVSVRDLSDSFLGSDLTYGDISYRNIDQDEYQLIRIDQDKNGTQYYVILSKPKEADPQYAKKVSWYIKKPDMNNCVKVRVNYYDKKDQFLKQQNLKWQKVDGPQITF